MKGTRGKVHVIMICQDCEWKSEDYLTAERCARKHAEKYKHRVNGEVAFAVRYNGTVEQ